jgi:hypothetical protein
LHRVGGLVDILDDITVREGRCRRHGAALGVHWTTDNQH